MNMIEVFINMNKLKIKPIFSIQIFCPFPLGFAITFKKNRLNQTMNERDVGFSIFSTPFVLSAFVRRSFEEILLQIRLI